MAILTTARSATQVNVKGASETSAHTSAPVATPSSHPLPLTRNQPAAQSGVDRLLALREDAKRVLERNRADRQICQQEMQRVGRIDMLQRVSGTSGLDHAVAEAEALIKAIDAELRTLGR